MKEEIERALQADSLVDITTTGRKTGKPHKLEIAFHYLDQDIYISGIPGKRDWYANLVANPEFTFHLKQSTQVDIPAKATPIHDEVQRRKILARIVQKWGRQDELGNFVKNSPLVEVHLNGGEDTA